MLATLADLLAPVSFADFLEAFRSRKRLHIKACDPTRAEGLLSWRDIDNLLSEHALDDNVAIMRDGVRVQRHLFTSSEGKQFKVRAFHDLLPQGISIVVNDIERWVPQISQLSVAIEREMGIHTNVNGYLSFSKGGAFKPHWDTMDVLVVQIHGSKQWRIWNAQVPNPIKEADATKVNTGVAPDQEIQLAAGDILFIPRGEPHCAAVTGEYSVHLTIGLISLTGIDFLRHLGKEAANDPLLCMNLPRHLSDEQSRAHETALKHQLHRLIDAASMSQILLEDDLVRLPVLQTAMIGTLPQKDDILRLTLRRRVPLPDVAEHDGPQSVVIGGEAQRLSPASIDILRWLFDHDPVTLRTLCAGLAPRHDRGSIKNAIRELYRFGFLVVNRSA